MGTGMDYKQLFKQHSLQQIVEAVLAGCADGLAFASVEGAFEDGFYPAPLLGCWVRGIDWLGPHTVIILHLPSHTVS